MSKVAVLLALLASLGVGGDAPPADEAVALVVSATGQPALATASDGDARPVRAFDRLAAGTVVETAEQSGAVVALASGRRYELGPGARVRVGPESVDVLKGRVRELARVAPLPRLAALSPDARPGSRAGALRIRGRRIRDLYPAGDATVPADATTLSFSALPGIARYQVEVEDEEGEPVFRGETPGAALALPRDVLRPGARYRWLVKGASAQGPARGEAEFSTLGEAEATARRDLRASLEGAEDAPSLALLAEVDRSLGLLREARDTFVRALEASPADRALRDAVERVDAQLRNLQPPE